MLHRHTKELGGGLGLRWSLAFKRLSLFFRSGMGGVIVVFFLASTGDAPPPIVPVTHLGPARDGDLPVVKVRSSAHRRHLIRLRHQRAQRKNAHRGVSRFKRHGRVKHADKGYKKDRLHQKKELKKENQEGGYVSDAGAHEV